MRKSSSSDELRALYRKEADFSRKRYGRFLQKERTFVQKGTDFLPKRNAPFRRKTDRNKKTRMCFILVFTFSTIPFFSRCKKKRRDHLQTQASNLQDNVL